MLNQMVGFEMYSRVGLLTAFTHFVIYKRSMRSRIRAFSFLLYFLIHYTPENFMFIGVDVAVNVCYNIEISPQLGRIF